MEEETFKKLVKEGKAKEIKEEKEEKPEEIRMPVERPTLEDFITFLEMLRQMKRHRTTAPTHKPKSFLEQIELYDDGTNRRIYFYINGVWRYATLT